MKVLNLRCGAGHVFEGWFASEDDYASQCERGLLDCPVCGRAEVARLPSAPRLNLSGAQPPAQADAPLARLAEAIADVLRSAEDVGPRFAEEARRIHHGESRARTIRGQATPGERAALSDEGIEVLSLSGLLPPKTTLQ